MWSIHFNWNLCLMLATGYRLPTADCRLPRLIGFMIGTNTTPGYGTSTYSDMHVAGFNIHFILQSLLFTLKMRQQLFEY